MSLRYINFQSLHYRILYQGPLAWLWLEKLYRAMIRIHQWAYETGLLRTYHLPTPVISIGNLTTGGTGKTPLTLSLAQHLESQGKRVAILSRGYGAMVQTRFHEADSSQYGDEPAWMQQQLRTGKVFVGSDRVYVGRQVIQTFQPDVIVLDDGFQHRRLYRNLNIVLIDGERGLGNGHLLPAGPLREPISQLKRADWVVVTKTASIPDFLNPIADSRFLTCPFTIKELWCPAPGHSENENESLDGLQERTVILLSGIAQPESFADTVASLPGKPTILEHLQFPDHKAYQESDLSPLIERLTDDVSLILVTTEKDWVKLAVLIPVPLWHQVTVVRLIPHIDWDSILKPLLPAVTLAS